MLIIDHPFNRVLFPQSFTHTLRYEFQRGTGGAEAAALAALVVHVAGVQFTLIVGSPVGAILVEVLAR